ncbi:crotonase [Pelagibius litoralis]|uniref:Crotonase n=1 Tax=Pelagibius litoralis TaxID=374515 RepID=A0A967F435_9PROT|nr:enoyl-CoA hydratase-related protein [Pelagibius litoralis]NIA72505.1 crotonase [Pelagibius litoralis]
MTVHFHVRSHVARVTIDRPERMNAVDTATHQALEKVWQTIEQEPDIRCVVLTGAGDRAFCAGADLKDDSGQSGLEYWAGSSRNGFGAISLRQSLSVPVIARVNGVALGGGMEMVLGCDIVVASESARFGLPEARVGRVPLDGGMGLLPRLIPRNVAVGMMMTGRLVSASEMAHCGLVNAVVPDAELDAETDRWIADLLASAPLSLRAIKAAVRQTEQMSPGEAQAHKTPDLVAALISSDAEEGVRAFREKRPPNWTGK